MKITIIGNGSALPAYGRFPTAQVIEINQQLFLIDCGEGTQMRMKQFDIKSMRINHLFISHAHGDHYFGLVGLISSMALLGREKKLYIYCNAFIKKVIDLQIPWNLSFEIEYRFIAEGEHALLVQHEKYEVSCFPVNHSVPTHGFLFVEKKRKRILLPDKVKQYEIPTYFYSKLTEGEDYIDKYQQVIQNEWVTSEGNPYKKYAFCADTIFNPEICKYIHGVDLLYHETTYLEEHKEKAVRNFHATAKEAGIIARNAKVGRLMIGHLSSRYEDFEAHLIEARKEFYETVAATEGKTFVI